MRRGRLVALAAVAAVVGVGGCGGDDDGGGGGSDAAQLDRPEAPKQPTAEECARVGRVERASRNPGELVTPAGEYRFRTKGTQTLDGRTEPLPRETRLIVTPARAAGPLRCFRVQRRYTDKLGDTALATVAGPTAYASEFLSQGGGQMAEFRLQPPIPLSTDELARRGTFTGTLKAARGSVDFEGPASGQYESEYIGRRSMSVGGRSVRVVGVRLRLSMAGGDVRATEVSERWGSVDHNILVAETVTQTRAIAGEQFRLKYEAELEALEPE